MSVKLEVADFKKAMLDLFDMEKRLIRGLLKKKDLPGFTKDQLRESLRGIQEKGLRLQSI